MKNSTFWPRIIVAITILFLNIQVYSSERTQAACPKDFSYYPSSIVCPECEDRARFIEILSQSPTAIISLIESLDPKATDIILLNHKPPFPLKSERKKIVGMAYAAYYWPEWLKKVTLAGIFVPLIRCINLDQPEIAKGFFNLTPLTPPCLQQSVPIAINIAQDLLEFAILTHTPLACANVMTTAEGKIYVQDIFTESKDEGGGLNVIFNTTLRMRLEQVLQERVPVMLP